MEGLALHREGISPYSGDIFHEVSYTFFNQVYRNLNILLWTFNFDSYNKNGECLDFIICVLLDQWEGLFAVILYLHVIVESLEHADG